MARRKTSKRKAYRAKRKQSKAYRVRAKPWKFTFKGFLKALNLKF